MLINFLFEAESFQRRNSFRKYFSMWSLLFGNTAQVLPSQMKELPEELRGSAVITVSHHGESASNGIKSVLKNVHFFKDVHINRKNTYAAYQEDVQDLRAQGIVVYESSVFNEQKLHTLLRIDVPPDARMEEATLFALWDAMANDHTNVAGVASQLAIIPYQDMTWREWFNDFVWGGFVLVLYYFDAFRWLVSGAQYIGTNDVRASRMSRVYPSHLRDPPNRWYLWWIGTGIAPVWKNDLVQDPSDRGMSLVARIIRTHRHLTWVGMWWLGLIVFQFCFGLPWWNYVISRDIFIGHYLYRDMSTILWRIYYPLICIPFLIAVWNHVQKYPPYLLGIHSVMFPVYATLLLPIIFLFKCMPQTEFSQLEIEKKRE